MDLDRLKHLLEGKAEKRPYSSDELKKILESRTKSTLVRIEKKLVYEIVLFALAIVAVGCLMVCVKVDIPPALIDITIAALLFFLVLYLTLYVRVHSTHPADQSVREALVRTIRVLDAFIKLYIYGTTVLILLGYVISIGYANPELTRETDWLEFALLYVLPGILLGGFSWAFMRWYSYRMFGRHLRSLQHYLADLNEAE